MRSTKTHDDSKGESHINKQYPQLQAQHLKISQKKKKRFFGSLYQSLCLAFCQNQISVRVHANLIQNGVTNTTLKALLFQWKGEKDYELSLEHISTMSTG